ncbi:MAG: hypothetical protein IPK79_01320 [Vampirovibrionales bacterium]|nr:hypothetical protein [Vampirovibrionales bacterium]
MLVKRSDFPGPNGERNYLICCDWAKYPRPRNTGKGIRGVIHEGSYEWIAKRHGVTQRVCIGVVWRWRNLLKRRGKKLQLSCEPFRPRTSY